MSVEPTLAGMLRDVTGTNKLDGMVTVLGILERSLVTLHTYSLFSIEM